MVVRDVLDEHGLRGLARRRRARRASTSTCASSRRWDFTTSAGPRWPWRARSSAACRLATSKWWKEERHGVFVDYNQNARDRTVASAYSVRPTPDARVSSPLTGTRSTASSCATCGWTRSPIACAKWRSGGRHRRVRRHAGPAARLAAATRRRAWATRPGRRTSASRGRAQARTAQPRPRRSEEAKPTPARPRRRSSAPGPAASSRAPAPQAPSRRRPAPARAARTSSTTSKGQTP